MERFQNLTKALIQSQWIRVKFIFIRARTVWTLKCFSNSGGPSIMQNVHLIDPHSGMAEKIHFYLFQNHPT